MGYYLSRQRDFKDNCLYVEISCTGSKNAGVDVLTARFPMEGKNYVDPRDAVRLAEDMYRLWDRQYGDETKRLRIVGIETPLYYDFTTKGLDAAKTWADRIFANMTKCASCGKAMGNKEPYNHDDLANVVFCTEYCIAKRYREVYGMEPASIASGKKSKVVVK
jgi:hypothetical protein